MLSRLERARLPLLLLVLLASFGVRVLGLGIQDLSDDEAFFVQIAHQGTYLQLAGSAEPHPPLYLALLQGWMLAGGVTEYAVRFLSVLFGVATAAAAYQLGREVAGARLGLAAAAVAALNPYQIFYSQTARDYQIACFFGLVSMVALLFALRRPRWLPAYVASALLAIFSHYYALAIVLFEQALLLGWLWRRRFKGLRRWLAADGCIAVVFLPWAAYSLGTVAAYEPGHGTAAIVGDTLRQTFQFYNFGTAFRPGDVVAPAVVVAALIALGLWGLARAGGGRALGLSVGYQLAPVVFGLATLLHTTQFGARFLFLGSPGYLLVIAGAIVLLARWWAAWLAPLAVLGGLAGFAIHNTTFSDQFSDKAYSRLAAYLADHIGPNDAVVLNGISQSLQYWYYAQLRDGIGQRVAILPLKADGGGADGSPVDLGQTRRALDQLTGASSGIWLIDDDSLRYDPNLDTQRMLAARGFRALSQGFRGQRLDFYALGSPGALAPTSASFDAVRLAQASRLDRAVPAGGTIPLRLEWQAARDNPPPFKESLRLVDASGTVVSQQDGAPGAGFWPAAWPTGQARQDQPGLLVPVGTLPGSFALQLVAYDAAGGKALGAPVELQAVRVDHSAPQRISASGLAPAGAAAGGEPSAAVGIGDEPAPAIAAAGGERLVGVGVAPSVAAGEKLPVTLLWAGGPTSSPAAVSLTLGSARVERQLGGAAYPTTAWRAGDVVRDTVALRVPASLASGDYPLLLGQTQLASVRVLPATRLFSPPPIAHASDWRFGEVAQLLGWQLDPTPGGVRVRIIWKALSEGDVSYTAFVHALGPDGKVAAQVDRPLGTDNWDTGEVVPADYELAVSGPYTLELGLYNARGGDRLPVCAGDSGCSHPADHVNLVPS